MFGYTRPQPDELLVREYELYRAVYCGLCKVGGKRISKLTRFFLNYDFVFLCLVRTAVMGDKSTIKKERCPYHLKKRPILQENDSMVYTAAAFAVLTYYKIKDDIKDSKGFKKLFKWLALPLFKRMKKRALRLYPKLDNLNIPLSELYILEENGCESIDKTADAFARTMAAAASEGTEGEKHEILAQCGYHTGRYIYIIDAFEDSAEDEKNKEYNVLNIHYGSSKRLLEKAEEIETTVADSTAAFCRSFEKSGCCFDNLIYNIIEKGSKNAYNKALSRLKGIQE